MAADATHGVGQVGTALDLAAEQLGGHLGVGLGRERHALEATSSARSGAEVLGRIVVNQRNAAVRRGVRVRVVVSGGAAMGEPARVPDAQAGGRQRVGRDRRVGVDDLAGLLAHLGRAVGDHRHTGESYPRYSIRRRPSTTTRLASRGPT